ncbi:serine hydrolase [Candidatus Bathyarchaeota archaeon]|nr:serine hydrolase [Candidatus Bathyarchaeota archaeon]
MSLIEKLEKISNNIQGILGISLKYLETGEEIFINGDVLFPFASIFKVPVIVTLYNRVDDGKIGLEEKVPMTAFSRVPGSGVLRELTPGLVLSIRDYRSLMMMISDNTATDIIVQLLGKNKINLNMKQLGLEKTNITTCREILFELGGLLDLPYEDRTIERYKSEMSVPASIRPRSEVDETRGVTTPKEMLTLLEKIYNGEAASRNSCDEIIELMKLCQTGGNRIPKHLPRELVKIAHKTGSIRGVVNDTAIIYPKNFKPYILCCFTKHLKDSNEGEEAIAEVSKTVYEYYSK